MDLVNLTPHTIVLVYRDTTRAIPPSTQFPTVRVQQRASSTYTLDEIPVKVLDRCLPLEANLPPRQPNTVYIVSRLVADFFSDREDFVFPYDLRRTETGGITGCFSLARFERCADNETLPAS